MRLTTKGRFAVTAMIDLGLRQNSGPVTLAAISQRQQISLSYLEQLFGKLRRHELVLTMPRSLVWPKLFAKDQRTHQQDGSVPTFDAIWLWLFGVGQRPRLRTGQSPRLSSE